MKICPKCSAHNLDTWKECGRCHTALTPETAADDSPELNDPYAAKELMESIKQVAPAPRVDSSKQSWLMSTGSTFGMPIHMRLLAASFILFVFLTLHAWTPIRTYLHGKPLTTDYVDTTRAYTMQIGMDTGLHAWFGGAMLLLLCAVVSMMCIRAELREV